MLLKKKCFCFYLAIIPILRCRPYRCQMLGGSPATDKTSPFSRFHSRPRRNRNRASSFEKDNPLTQLKRFFLFLQFRSKYTNTHHNSLLHSKQAFIKFRKLPDSSYYHFKHKKTVFWILPSSILCFSAVQIGLKYIFLQMGSPQIGLMVLGLTADRVATEARNWSLQAPLPSKSSTTCGAPQMVTFPPYW